MFTIQECKLLRLSLLHLWIVYPMSKNFITFVFISYSEGASFGSSFLLNKTFNKGLNHNPFICLGLITVSTGWCWRCLLGELWLYHRPSMYWCRDKQFLFCYEPNNVFLFLIICSSILWVIKDIITVPTLDINTWTFGVEPRINVGLDQVL